MAASPIPTALDDRLCALENRVHKLLVIGGACRFALAVLAATVAIFVLDAAFQLSVAARCLLELGWLALVGFLAWRLVLRPWNEEIPLEELDAFPTRPIARLAGFTALIAFASVSIAVATPGIGEHFRRVALPWHRPTAVPSFEIVVTSGDSVVRRGDPITLVAYLKPRDANAVLPDSATLAIREVSEGVESKLPLNCDVTGTFHLTRPSVNDDFDYRVEVGSAASEWHTVRVADAVELTDRSSVEIVPPTYVSNWPTKSIAGFTDLEGLQHSVAHLRLRFNRPAESALLEWRPDGRAAIEASDAIPVAVSPDRLSGTAAIRLTGSGTLRAVLVNESGPRKLRTETVVNVRAILDAPPRFERVSGVVSQVRTVRPGERVDIEFAAIDDIGVASAELEYAIGPEGGASIRVPISLAGAGTTLAEGHSLFDLAGKGNAGGVVRYRLRAFDTRRVDEAKFGPQEVVFPPSGWSELRLSDSAPPLDRQEIFGQRDSSRDRVNAAVKEVAESHAEADALRADTAGRSPLPIDHALRLTAIRERIRKAVGLLDEAGREAVLTPDLRLLAQAIREVAERSLADADDALRKASIDDAAARSAALATTLVRLHDAQTRLEDLLKRNERLAQDRLDRRRLEALASDQGSLADRAKPGSETPREELLKRQRELLTRLTALTAESDSLKRGVAAAAALESAKFVAEGQAISARLRDLDVAANRVHADLRQSLLEALSATQRKWIRDSEPLQTRLETPARLAGVAAMKREDFQRVADLLAQDKIVPALTELERLAQGLDRMAEEFDQWTADRNDPKIAATQLAKWQGEFRTRFLAATKSVLFEKLPEARKLAFRDEQDALEKSTGRLKLPAEVGGYRDAALVHLRMAAKRLVADGTGAEEAMKYAAESLAKLAEKTPSLTDRLTRSRTELDRIRFEQDAIVAAAEQVLRQHEKQVPTALVVQALIGKFVPLQLKQQKLGDRLAKLDVPGFELRQARAVRAARAASSDLSDGLPFDTMASLAGSKRELDRLRQVLDKLPCNDDKADELAHKQSEVARLMLAAGERATVRQLEPIVALQQDVFKQIGSLVAPEAAGLLFDAHEAVKAAERSLRDGSKHTTILRLTREAAESLAVLADRLGDREVERDRIRRLAENRRQGVCLAKKLAGQPLSADASAKAIRDLGFEVEELMGTRVGAAGQVAKKTVHDHYTRLRATAEPDRKLRDQKQLAEALAELANAMEAAHLTARPAPPPENPDPAETFLPSHSNAELLRDLARQQRELRERANALAAELATRTKPAEKNPLAALAEGQRELAAVVDGWARALATEKDVSANDAGQAAEAAKLAADRLAVGAVRAARQSGQLAASRLRKLTSKTAASLATAQEALLGELLESTEDPTIAAAQQKARQEALVKEASEFAHMLDVAAKDAPAGGGSAKVFVEAADLARQAERRLNDAAKTPAEAAGLRGEADRLLHQAAEKAAVAGVPPDKNLPEANASGAAVLEVERAMKRAIWELGATGDAAVEPAMRRATDALNRAAKLTGTESPPKPNGMPVPGS